MTFSEQVIARLGHIIDEYKLVIMEESAYYLKLQSPHLKIGIARDQLERSNSIWIGRNSKNADTIEIDNYVLKEFFHTNLRLSEATTEEFLDNLDQFLSITARPLLLGHTKRLEDLEKFDLKRSRAYTDSVIFSQDLNKVDRAWDEENYKLFIKLMDKLDKSKLPSSYFLKYKIALRKTYGNNIEGPGI